MLVIISGVHRDAGFGVLHDSVRSVSRLHTLVSADFQQSGAALLLYFFVSTSKRSYAVRGQLSIYPGNHQFPQSPIRHDRGVLCQPFSPDRPRSRPERSTSGARLNACWNIETSVHPLQQPQTAGSKIEARNTPLRKEKGPC
ncbi:hypothetical protein HRR83_003359 [Exophiala dermatitidis]|uniref:Uncharacterized protein n=1 Tax=Exophiala dermatitidis TaxID=5970 RepID=A0AAN6EYE7_EXODE|nr:hypothetical protein HRR74_004483 [Exophiala dermatitidis]KAJ4521086.1 hypothetical protein HRR73_003427 [Exophiala dermatitidis]KAJ4547670.1 hypothetical protein HRR76_000301 [Exophiala dermatitidis]KAJ4553608.1 hypothetical protein HRR77_001989 [Exophiala dermatitidis]KAJ4577935.1 hypothetical protein HRR79_001259 [Exophiala dermatitidis]